VMFCLIPAVTPGQVAVDGTTINKYSSVLEIYSSSESDPDSVRVSMPGLFTRGDTCLFHVARGAEIYNAVDHPGVEVLWGKIYNMNNSGVYGIMIIESITDSVIVFSAPLPHLVTSSRPQIAQLLRINTARPRSAKDCSSMKYKQIPAQDVASVARIALLRRFQANVANYTSSIRRYAPNAGCVLKNAHLMPL